MSNTTNLLKETIDALKENNKDVSDVEWVGIKDKFYTDWDSFKETAKSIFYDDGFGGIEINSHLIIVGKDFWLSREEYDGSEWWQFNIFPIKPNLNAFIIKTDICYNK